MFTIQKSKNISYLPNELRRPELGDTTVVADSGDHLPLSDHHHPHNSSSSSGATAITTAVAATWLPEFAVGLSLSSLCHPNPATTRCPLNRWCGAADTTNHYHNTTVPELRRHKSLTTTAPRPITAAISR
ncbi:hypothetical protein Hanom_Chr14g01269451 [Helianthus anomalus]